MVNLGKLLGGNLDIKKVQQVVDLVWDNKDDLANSAKFAKEIPDFIRTLASGLSEAGNQARAAGLALVGEDGRSGATTRLGSSATTLGSIADNLTSIATFVADAADDVEKVPMMGGPARQLGGAAKTIRDTTSGLGGLADDLVGLAEILGNVGAALSKLGDSLDASGTKAQGFVTQT
jgi:transketolase C-terminal domain/subunit